MRRSQQDEWVEGNKLPVGQLMVTQYRHRQYVGENMSGTGMAIKSHDHQLACLVQIMGM